MGGSRHDLRTHSVSGAAAIGLMVVAAPASSVEIVTTPDGHYYNLVPLKGPLPRTAPEMITVLPGAATASVAQTSSCRLTNFQNGPVTAKLCNSAIWKLPSISRRGRSGDGSDFLQKAHFVKNQRSGSRKCMPPPILLGQGEPAKCQKWLPFSPKSATGQPPKCGNEASSHGGQNAQLRGHWAANALILPAPSLESPCEGNAGVTHRAIAP